MCVAQPILDTLTTSICLYRIPLCTTPYTQRSTDSGANYFCLGLSELTVDFVTVPKSILAAKVGATARILIVPLLFSHVTRSREVVGGSRCVRMQ